MISFGQVLILVFLGLLLFGDSRQLLNRVVLFFVNCKTVVQKVFTKKKDDSPKI
jgi:hypothetical protein